MKKRLIIAAAASLLFTSASLHAQSAVTVTTNAGDESVGSLGWAVTTLNAAGAGAITFNPASNSITLTQALPALTQNVTFQGPGNNLIGQDNSQSQFFFQQGLNQQENLNFQNNGSNLSGFDVAVTASSWTMGNFNVANLNGASAGNTTASGGVNVGGADGGNATALVGNWTTGISVYLYGGAGGSVTDTNGSGDQGGAGGSASVSAATFTMPGTGYFYLNGGAGGSATDLGTGTNTGGRGGSALAAFGAVSISNSGNVGINGGSGGAGVTGGNGGGANLTAASVSLYQNLDVQGGAGANGVSAGGNGGNGFVSMGSYFGAAGSNFQLTGGNGGSPSSGSGGNGGNVVAEGGSVSMTGGGSPSPIFKILGGNGNGGLSGGNGGTAAVTFTDMSLGSNTSFQVAGGSGGYAYPGAIPGNGGQGGKTSLTLGNFSLGVSTVLNISSGNGGTGSVAANPGGTGGDGGAGGVLAMSVGNLNLGTGSSLYLNGGTGGNGGGVPSAGTGGAGGAGGSVSLSIGAVTMGLGNYLSISGGNGGSGGVAGTNGNDGALGQASAFIGNLNGPGTVFMAGNAVLQVGQGSFSGSLNGSETFEKIGSGALTLSGTNDYSGGTSVLAGALVVDSSGTLGTREVQVGSGGLLDYIDSSTAVNVVTVTGGAVRFQDSSSAALATIALQTGSSAYFAGSASGGIAAFIDSAGTTLDISGSSTGVTIGSLAGAGLVTLGGNALGVGANSASTSFSGVIAGAGSFNKIGGGSLTLSGADTYSGGTNLAAGTLAVGNSQALGTGAVAVGGGILSTAGSPLTFQVGGNYLQGSGGTLQMGLGGAGASSQDRLNITGTANLGGALNLTSYGTLSALPVGSTIVLVNAASISGAFQQVEEDYNGVRLLPLYLPTEVELESIIPSFQAVGTTSNQRAMGADLDGLALSPSMSGLMSSIGVLSNNNMQAAYSQLSPEDFTALYQAAFEGAQARATLVDQRLSRLMDDVDSTAWLPGFSSTGTPWFAGNIPAAKEAAMAPQKASSWGGFISGDGGFFNVTGDSNAAGYKVTTFGLTGAGADIRLSREAVAGLLVGYGHTDVTPGTGGTLAADGGQAGLYGLFYSDGFYGSALVEGGLNNYTTQRLGYGGTAKGSTQGSQVDGAAELGYQFKSGQLKVGPMASVQYSSVSLNSFTEQGSQAPLALPAQSADSLMGRLGLRAQSHWSLGGDSALNPSLQLAWEHETDFSGGNVQAGFGTGDGFTVAGPQIGQDGIMAGAGVEISWSKSLTLALHYQGEFGRTNLNSNQFGAGMRLGF